MSVFCSCTCMLIHSVMSDSTGVGCHSLLQGICPTQGPNPCLLGLPHWQVDSLPLSLLGSPICSRYVPIAEIDMSLSSDTSFFYTSLHWELPHTLFHSKFPHPFLHGLPRWFSDNPPANAGDARDTNSTPGLGRSPGVGKGNPFQYSCLENSMERNLAG